MKITSPKPRFINPLIIGCTLAALLTVSALTYVYAFHGSLFGWTARTPSTSHTSSVNSSAPTKAQQDAGTNTKKANVDNSAPTSSSSSTPTKGSVTTPQSSPVTTADGKTVVDVEITSSGQTASAYQLRTIIYSVQSTGTCTLTLTRSGYSPIVQTAGIQPLPSSSTCKGFDIPLSQLASGTWQANVAFSNSSVSGSVTQSITVK